MSTTSGITRPPETSGLASSEGSQKPTAARLVSLDAFRGFIGVFFPAAGDDDIGALFHKKTRGGKTHTAIAPGNDGYFS